MKTEAEILEKAFQVGMQRTDDVIAEIPPGDEGQSEIIGIATSAIFAIAQRGETHVNDVCAQIANLLTCDDEEDE